MGQLPRCFQRNLQAIYSFYASGYGARAGADEPKTDPGWEQRNSGWLGQRQERGLPPAHRRHSGALTAFHPLRKFKLRHPIARCALARVRREARGDYLILPNLPRHHDAAHDAAVRTCLATLTEASANSGLCSAASPSRLFPSTYPVKSATHGSG
jgi:hypothetical protein